MDRPLALVVALATERRALEQRLAAPQVRRLGSLRLTLGEIVGQAVVLIQAGVGPARARAALLAAAREYRFHAAWSLGLAGGLAEDLAPGDLLCPGVVLLDDGRQGQALAPTAPFAVIGAALRDANRGSLLTVEAPLRTAQAKRLARERTGAVAVDMEAAGVATAARELEIPWLAIKAVADDAREPLPEFLAGCTTPAGDLRWRALLWSCLYGERRRVFRRMRREAGLATLSLKRNLDVALRAGSP